MHVNISFFVYYTNIRVYITRNSSSYYYYYIFEFLDYKLYKDLIKNY